uniref:Bm8232 n=1 Tax=Brugia malayi TaxID=6279 RepID=A0A0J9YBP9_BRUMA|nr:Bm8232 [Brugia malayi]
MSARVQQESHRWRSMWQGWVMALQQAQRSVIARAAREARAGASKSDASSLSLFWAKHAQLRTFFPSDVMTIITNSLAVKLCSAPQSIMLLKPLPTRRIVKAEDISDEIMQISLISTKESIMPNAMLEKRGAAVAKQWQSYAKWLEECPTLPLCLL